MHRWRRTVPTAALLLALPPLAAAGQQTRDNGALRSAAVRDIGYVLHFDSTTAELRVVDVAMHFRTTSAQPVLLSIPAWTPGAFETGNFARYVMAFEAHAGGRPLRWDKADADTWRVFSRRDDEVTVSFRYAADTLDAAMAWSRRDFLMVNGTNVLPYPEGQPFEFSATVEVRTEPGWRVATGMQPIVGRENTFRGGSYHDLADMPLFIGRFDLDSVTRDGGWDRLATYPAGAVKDDARVSLRTQIGDMVRVQSAIFGETPFESYTALVILDEAATGGSSLGHQNSHVGIYAPNFIGNPILSLVTAHSIFHAWNGTRLRPADLLPTRYDAVQPTPWLWFIEGITGYYADLTLTRAGIITPELFVNITESKLYRVDVAPPVALEDASLSAVIRPIDGTAPLYGEKGSLAGWLLDILIRDASDNRGSLDSVLRELYASTWSRGRGFTPEEWWRAVARAAGGVSFDDFRMRYIDGREPYPFVDVLPLAGFTFISDTIREPRIGVQTRVDGEGVRIVVVQPGSMAQEAGIRIGDYLLAVGDVEVDDTGFGARFRQRYADAQPGTRLGIALRRRGDRVWLEAPLHFAARVENRIDVDPAANGKPLRIRDAMLFGTSPADAERPRDDFAARPLRYSRPPSGGWVSSSTPGLPCRPGGRGSCR